MIIIIENTNARIVEKKICRYRRKRRDRVIRRRLALKRNSSFIYPDRLKIVSSLLLKEMEKRGYISAQYKITSAFAKCFRIIAFVGVRVAQFINHLPYRFPELFV